MWTHGIMWPSSWILSAPPPASAGLNWSTPSAPVHACRFLTVMITSWTLVKCRMLQGLFTYCSPTNGGIWVLAQKLENQFNTRFITKNPATLYHVTHFTCLDGDSSFRKNDPILWFCSVFYLPLTNIISHEPQMFAGET